MGATKNNTGGHLKIRGTGKNSNMRGHTKFRGGFKNIGCKASRGTVTEGCIFLTVFEIFSKTSGGILPPPGHIGLKISLHSPMCIEC